ncbi:MAG: acetyl-CoA C-acetyltransferase [Planctomycetota bacterium]
MTDAVILSAVRTPIGRFQGTLAHLSAPQLGAIAVKEALARAGIEPGLVDEVILGNVLQAGLGQNPARQAALEAGIPDTVPSMTINKVCGSGMKCVMLAAQAIKAGEAECVVAGGMESMTRTPYMIPKARDGLRLGDGKLVDLMVHDGLWDAYNDYHMGNTGELIANELEVSREAQDEYAAESHRRASAAAEAGEFDREMVPIEIKPRKKDPFEFKTDEGVRAGVSAESLGKLRPAFAKEGSVTAGNASQLSDGASAVIVCSAAFAEKHGLTPRAKIVASASAAREPERVMFAPIDAVKMLMEKMGVGIDHFDLIELNEPFSSASVGVCNELGVDMAKTNIRGGAVALGHPIGATGARILTTLLHAMEDKDVKTGMAGLCLGGGGAVCMAIERA